MLLTTLSIITIVLFIILLIQRIDYKDAKSQWEAELIVTISTLRKINSDLQTDYSEFRETSKSIFTRNSALVDDLKKQINTQNFELNELRIETDNLKTKVSEAIQKAEKSVQKAPRKKVIKEKSLPVTQ
jgi:septal ring factor EnvC (AmiA/AmiB activator)